MGGGIDISGQRSQTKKNFQGVICTYHVFSTIMLPSRSPPPFFKDLAVLAEIMADQDRRIILMFKILFTLGFTCKF